MSATLLFTLFAIYFGMLMLVTTLAGRKARSNEAFFLGNRQSPWWVVAIGMVGSSISGVSFISVPGMVGGIGFTYMQTVVGFFFGYIVVAKLLLPLYYKLQITSIYSYLNQRLGVRSYKTGASFFLLSKLIGASARLYVVALVLQTLVLNQWHVPFPLTVTVIVLLIWLYTFRSGMKSIVWTDTVQALVMMAALGLITYELYTRLRGSGSLTLGTFTEHPAFRLFEFSDWFSKQHFVKQFFSGIFIVIVMTGLDQDMMQKNLSCKSLSDAQKNMYWYGFAFIPINFLFLLLGLMLIMFASQKGITLPAGPDQILPFLVSSHLGVTVQVLFFLGVLSAAFNSADSAIIALTTSFSVDILGVENKSRASAEKTRRWIHVAISVLFIAVILLFNRVNNKSVIDAIYIIASYSYGPLLGMFAFGLFTNRAVNDKLAPYIAILSPLICYALSEITQLYFGYKFGYELLMLNGFITFAGLWLSGSVPQKFAPR